MVTVSIKAKQDILYHSLCKKIGHCLKKFRQEDYKEMLIANDTYVLAKTT